MKKRYILAHDLGTSGNKATLYDIEGMLCVSSVYRYKTNYLKANWIEQNPNDWWRAICITTKNIIEKAEIDKQDILCITFSGQMMGCLLVDECGNPLKDSIIWADMRAEKQKLYMDKVIGMENMYRITGNRIGESYTAAKLLWIKENEPEIYNKAYKVIQAKDYIILKLTGEFVTDYSDASGTNLFDLKEKVWSDEIISGLGIDKNLLPKLHPSTDVVGTVKKEISEEVGLLEGTKVVIGGADGACATVGAVSVDIGSTYNVLGTSSWVATTLDKPIEDKEMKTFTFNHLDENLYIGMGTMQSAGHSFNWFKETFCELEDKLGKEQNISPFEIISKSILETEPGANNLIYLPYLLGERSPWWNTNAKGAFIGLSAKHTKKEISRSVLEGVTYNLKVIIEALEMEEIIDTITVIGGGARSDVWLQILADIWQKTIIVPQYLEEATSMGAAVCGGIGVGVFKDFSVIKNFNKEIYRITPRKEYAEKYNELYTIFKDSYEVLISIYDKLSRI